MPEPVTESSELDDILYEYTITHTGNSHNARCRCLGGTKSHLNYQLRELIARERQKAVEELTSNVDRFEVIDQTGRAYVKGSIYKTPVKVELSLQDDGRTLKAFVEPATQSNKGEAE